MEHEEEKDSESELYRSTDETLGLWRKIEQGFFLTSRVTSSRSSLGRLLASLAWHW